MCPKSKFELLFLLINELKPKLNMIIIQSKCVSSENKSAPLMWDYIAIALQMFYINRLLMETLKSLKLASFGKI